MSDIVTLNGYKIKDEKAVRSYETVALMKADTKLKEGYHVKTKGYYEANDGGHSEYIIVNDDTLVDDGGSIHVLNNGLRAKLLISDYVTPEQFGAYGDDTHDDSTAINNALSYSKELHLLNKTYSISNTINLNNNNIIKGTKNSIIHKITNSTIIKAIDKHGITLDGFTVTGERVNTTNQNGLSFTNCSNCNINNIKIDGISHDGVFLSTCEKINVSNMDISNTSFIGYICYQGNNCIFTDSVIDAENCEFKYNCQFKSTVNSVMQNITVINGTENSVMISRENLSDNPQSIIPINNIIQNIQIINHGINWSRSASGTYAAMFVEGYNTIVDNIQIYNSYTGGFAGNFNYGKLTNLIVDTFGLDEASSLGCHLYDGKGNTIDNILIKNGVNMFGFRSNYENSNFTNIQIEDVGATGSTRPKMQIGTKNSIFNNIILISNTFDSKGFYLNYGTTVAENTIINDISDVKMDNTFTEYCFNGQLPSTISMYSKNPIHVSIRGNFTKPFKYENDMLTIYEVETENQLSTITAQVGDTRVFSKSGLSTIGYEKSVYNGTSWVNVNSLS